MATEIKKKKKKGGGNGGTMCLGGVIEGLIVLLPIQSDVKNKAYA